MPTDMRKTLDKVLQFALTLPNTREDHPWGERVVKVGKKVFLFLGRDEGDAGVSVKLPISAGEALTLPFVEPTAYGLGKSGWISATFTKGTSVPFEVLCEWVRESYSAIAPKTLVVAMGMVSTKPPMAKRSSFPPKKVAALTPKKVAKKNAKRSSAKR